MKIIIILLFFHLLYFCSGNPVKRDGVQYDVVVDELNAGLLEIDKDDVPILIVELDESSESKSEEDGIAKKEIVKKVEEVKKSSESKSEEGVPSKLPRKKVIKKDGIKKSSESQSEEGVPSKVSIKKKSIKKYGEKKSSESQSEEGVPSKLPRKKKNGKKSSESKSEEGVPSKLLNKKAIKKDGMKKSSESQSDERISPKKEKITDKFEGIPLEFPYAESISIDKFYFEDGEWRLGEKPAIVVIEDDERNIWVNTDAPKIEAATKSNAVKKFHDGVGRERRNLFEDSVRTKTPPSIYDFILSLLPPEDSDENERKVIETKPDNREIVFEKINKYPNSNDIMKTDHNGNPIEELNIIGEDNEEEKNNFAPLIMHQITEGFEMVSDIYTRLISAITGAIALQNVPHPVYG